MLKISLVLVSADGYEDLKWKPVMITRNLGGAKRAAQANYLFILESSLSSCLLHSSLEELVQAGFQEKIER